MIPYRSFASVVLWLIISVLTTQARAQDLKDTFERALAVVSIDEAAIFDRATYFIKPNWRYVNVQAAAACGGADTGANTDVDRGAEPDDAGSSKAPVAKRPVVPVSRAICLFDFISVGAIGLGAIEGDLAGCGPIIDRTDFPLILALWLKEPQVVSALRHLASLPAAASDLKAARTREAAREFWADWHGPALERLPYFPQARSAVDRVARNGAADFLTGLAADPTRERYAALYRRLIRQTGILDDGRLRPDLVEALAARYRTLLGTTGAERPDEPRSGADARFADTLFGAAEAFYANKVRLCRMRGLLAGLDSVQRPVRRPKPGPLVRAEPRALTTPDPDTEEIERFRIIAEAGPRYCCRVGDRHAVYTRRQCAQSEGRITAQRHCSGIFEDPRDQCCLVNRAGQTLAGWVSRQECRRARGRMTRARVCWAYFDL
ncbi:MAG: hypothetical protein ACFB6R_03195 [Alphaproteobacteria bacterium]